MYSLEILDEADKEFAEAAEWYERRKAGLGERFIDVIRGKMELIREFPERYPKKKGNFRESVVRIFPYVIVYALYARKQTVVIHSIFHTRRNPKRKYRKR